MARRARTKPKQDEDTRGDGAPRRSASVGAARGIWSGSVSFGLLQIPVTLIPAESRSDELHFRLLDKRDLSPVRYQRVSASTGEPVEWKDIVKGYELDDDSFVVVEPDDFAKANVKATQTIEIQDFVPRAQIDAAFFETPYFIVPQARSSKAYVLLRDALAARDAVAIATFVLRTREHLVAVMPAGGALMLEVLRFGHQLKDVADIPLPMPEATAAAAPSERERAMAERLIDGMMTDWDPHKYKDRYHRDVMKIIDEKAKTGKTTEHHAPKAGTVAHDVVDLLTLLEKSVAKSSRAANDARPGPKKAGAAKAPATRPRKGAKRRRAA
ncbi:MAG: Ku protein [Labilithrix sp.]|nr:Ku protein [Labilithrix sp.]